MSKIRLKYDNKLLDEYIIRDGAELIGEYNKLHSKLAIQYYCKCKNNYTKN